ncbi:uncharacterized protein LOC106151089 [Lingula anatina]|uniref:Uncharacterized protein LOC106151089 n=1 Tax=Lingula anatina TaxID=7574 RepID=A0A1S3H122_LINAN|nr:uncharacterized protein LOC106151089 [Lingula anatina]|eukprot:XP_013379632.1 uncharacterized protein LOC106151089 [Lingula anatina]
MDSDRDSGLMYYVGGRWYKGGTTKPPPEPYHPRSHNAWHYESSPPSNDHRKDRSFPYHNQNDRVAPERVYENYQPYQNGHIGSSDWSINGHATAIPSQAQFTHSSDTASGLGRRRLHRTLLPTGGENEKRKKEKKANALKEHDEEHAEERRQRQRDRDPVLYCKFVANYPKSAFCITFGFHIAFVVVTGILMAARYDIFPVEFLSFPMNLNEDPTRLRDLAWRLRNNETGRIRRVTTDTVRTFWNRSATVDSVILYYEIPDGNVFTKDILQEMKMLEDDIYNIPAYQNSFCQLDFNRTCIKPRSILRYFDGSLAHISSKFNDPTFGNIPTVLFEAQNNTLTRVEFQYFLGIDYEVNPNTVRSKITRSSLPMGYPLETGGERDEQRKEIETFLVNDIVPKLKDSQKSRPKGLSLFYYSFLIFRNDILSQVVWDMVLAVGSFAFIFCFIWFQTRSLWITGWAVLTIVTGFCGANLIYRIVADFRYFGFFHILAIYIILGIGADDVFVFYDTWRETAQNKYISLAHRLSDCYRRAAGTMLVTSLTTMAAFLASSVSPLLPIRSFGVFAGIMIGVNYLTVITFLPAVVVIYHIYFKKYCCCCCAAKKERPDTNTGFDYSVHNNHREKDVYSSTKTGKKKVKENIVVRFFSGPFYRFATHKVARWIIVVLFLGIFAVGLYFVTTLEAEEEQLSLYRPGTNIANALDREAKAFVPADSDRFATVYIVWGLKQRDLSECHGSDIDCTGKAVWDNSFDLNTPSAQLALKNFCNRLRNLTDAEIDRLKIRRDLLTLQAQVNCFMDNLQVFLENEENKTMNGTAIYPNDLQLSLPLTERKMARFMGVHSYLYNSVPETFHRYFEIGLSYWLSAGYRLTKTADFDAYDTLLGEWNDDGFTQNIKTIPGVKYGTRLRYAAITVNLTLNPRVTGYVTGLPVMDAWENFVNDEVSRMPTPLQGGFQCTRNTWHFLKVQENLANTAITGIAIGIGIAFPLLVIATGNIIVGFLATLTMCMVTVCVVGMIPLLGWKLGVLSSLNLCLVVGLAVDYVVHLAEGYHISPHETRSGRIKDMLHHVGISVLSGACTTLGASVFMMFATIQFYVQFGVFIFSVIGFSCLFALFFFTAALSIIGPQGRFGSLGPAVDWFKDFCFQDADSAAGWISVHKKYLAFPQSTRESGKHSHHRDSHRDRHSVPLTRDCHRKYHRRLPGYIDNVHGDCLCGGDDSPAGMEIGGLAVDYVVHLAEGYHISPHETRSGRIKDMLHHVGISVLSGACTTLGASVFMMFATIQFYVQFGVFIFSVIGFSCLFALFFFTAALSIIGPQDYKRTPWAESNIKRS